VNVQRVWLCPFHIKPRPSGISLEFPGLGIISQVPGNRAEVAQNHDARKAVSASRSVLSEVGLCFVPEAQKRAFKKLCCVHSLQRKAIRSYFRVRGTGKHPQVPGNRAEVGQNYDGRKAVSATFSVLK